MVSFRSASAGEKPVMANTAYRESRQNPLYTEANGLTARSHALLTDAKAFFVGHDQAVGVLFVDGAMTYPMFLKSGQEGGPWGGTQRGGVPRGRGRGFTSGGPSQGNIATHVEGHAAAIMWQRKIRVSHLLVDRAMCSICSRTLTTTLPPDSTMFVYSDEEGETILRASHGR
jgi:hypothetical protein